MGIVGKLRNTTVGWTVVIEDDSENLRVKAVNRFQHVYVRKLAGIGSQAVSGCCCAASLLFHILGNGRCQARCSTSQGDHRWERSGSNGFVKRQGATMLTTNRVSKLPIARSCGTYGRSRGHSMDQHAPSILACAWAAASIAKRSTLERTLK